MSSITARRALLDLLNEGVVETRGGLGVFVTEFRRRLRICVMVAGYSEPSWRNHSGHLGQLIGGIASATWEQRATLIVEALNDPGEMLGALDDHIADGPVDGVLVRSPEEPPSDLLESLDSNLIPAVLLKRSSRHHWISSVMPDARRAGELSVERLVRDGHERIGLVASTSSIDTYREHRRGFEAALVRAGLEVRAHHIYEVRPSLPERAKAATDQLLRLPDRPTAIVTNSDLLAIGVYESAAELSMSVPEDLSVVSFDDLEFAEHMKPPLTTVVLNYYELGRTGALGLLARIKAGTEPTRDVIPTSLVERSSVAPPVAEA